ncbi:MAG: hypothetical protein QOD65_3239, partial [Gaiellales bacterium]|nr:hypothetical protein [Gaiellales bacterium]
MTEITTANHRVAAVTTALLINAAAVPILLLSSLEELGDPLTLVLAAAAVASVLTASRWDGAIEASAAFVCVMLAIAFVGPVGAFAVAVAAEVVSWPVIRRSGRPARLFVLPVNLASSAVPSLLGGIAFLHIAGVPMNGGAADVAVLGAVAAGLLAMNFVVLTPLMAFIDGGRLRDAMRPPRELLPSV